MPLVWSAAKHQDAAHIGPLGGDQPVEEPVARIRAAAPVCPIGEVMTLISYDYGPGTRR